MNILSLLARLEVALGRSIMTKQMILLPQFRPADFRFQKEINLAVGYNGSPRSQAALDLTLWIAHQTRLETNKPVTVQVVYVIDLINECSPVGAFNHQVTLRNRRGKHSEALANRTLIGTGSRATQQSTTGRRSGGAIAELSAVSNRSRRSLNTCHTEQFEQADYILWQARNLAEEWRGSLKTHLRFGQVAEELHHVVSAESASLLVLGCESPEHPLVKQFRGSFPCSVLGIPPTLPNSGVG